KFEDNQQKALHSLMEPIIVGRLITDRGFKEVAFVAGSSDTLYAVDADLGKLLWKRQFSYSSELPRTQVSTWLCPGGLTATPVIPAPGEGRGGGFAVRSVYTLSSDGQLHQLNMANGEDVAIPARFLPPNGKPYSLNLVDNVIYTTTGQRCGGN